MSPTTFLVAAIPLATLLFVGCGDDESSSQSATTEGMTYASEVVDFQPGEHAGYGQDDFPAVVLGPPGQARGPSVQEVLSLGHGGVIVLGFGGKSIVNGPGADFVVFENAFMAQTNPPQVFAELGEVSVSQDGEQWVTFPCSEEPESPGRWPGCAGWTPTKAFDPLGAESLDPHITGGDAFDLADVGLEEARFVRIRDLSFEGGAPTAGFDLDAVGAIHWQ